jgi:hypothetical protein
MQSAQEVTTVRDARCGAADEGPWGGRGGEIADRPPGRPGMESGAAHTRRLQQLARCRRVRQRCWRRGRGQAAATASRVAVRQRCSLLYGCRW